MSNVVVEVACLSEWNSLPSSFSQFFLSGILVEDEMLLISFVYVFFSFFCGGGGLPMFISAILILVLGKDCPPPHDSTTANNLISQSVPYDEEFCKQYILFFF